MPPKGYKYTPEQLERRRELTKRMWESQEYRDRVVKGLTGHEVTSEARQKIREARTGKPLSDEHKAVLRDRSLELWQSDDYRAKVIDAINQPEVKAKALTPERSAKISAAKRAYWQAMSQEQRTAMARNWSIAGMRGGQKTATPLETAVEAELADIGVIYFRQVVFDTYCADIYIPADGLIIECDGYWHSTPKIKEHDQRRDEWFRQHGFRVVRLTGSEIKGDARQAVLAALGRTDEVT